MAKARAGQRRTKTNAQLRRRLPKDYRPLLDAAIEAGARLREKRNGIDVATDRGSVMIHTTPSTRRRYMENTLAELRRIGVEV
jgi:hypothetical protein